MHFRASSCCLYPSMSFAVTGRLRQNNSSNYYDTTDELDVTSQLAASGHTVIRSERTKNDKVYTWVYTVSPLP